MQHSALSQFTVCISMIRCQKMLKIRCSKQKNYPRNKGSQVRNTFVGWTHCKGFCPSTYLLNLLYFQKLAVNYFLAIKKVPHSKRITPISFSQSNSCCFVMNASIKSPHMISDATTIVRVVATPNLGIVFVTR